MAKAPESPCAAPIVKAGHGRTATPDRVEIARYIADFAAELSSLARETRLDLLSYLLDMARLEAIRAVQAHHRQPPP